MKLILVNAPGLNVVTPTIPPSPSVVSNFFEFVIPITTVTSVVVTPVIDPNMSVDGMNVISKITFTITGTMQSGTQTLPAGGSIILNGSSVFTTENNQPLILLGDMANGNIIVSGAPLPTPATVTVKSCGQTSTFAE